MDVQVGGDRAGVEEELYGAWQTLAAAKGMDRIESTDAFAILAEIYTGNGDREKLEAVRAAMADRER